MPAPRHQKVNSVSFRLRVVHKGSAFPMLDLAGSGSPLRYCVTGFAELHGLPPPSPKFPVPRRCGSVPAARRVRHSTVASDLENWDNECRELNGASESATSLQHLGSGDADRGWRWRRKEGWGGGGGRKGNEGTPKGTAFCLKALQEYFSGLDQLTEGTADRLQACCFLLAPFSECR